MTSYCRRVQGYSPSVLIRKTRVRTKRLKTILSRILRTAFCGVLLLCATAMVNRLVGYIGQSSYLAAHDIEFEGCQRLCPQELMGKAEINSGTNLLTLRPKEISRNLKENRWVKDVTVERTFPQRLTIKVRERRPAAVVVDESLFLVDDDGFIFKKVERCDPINLPIITGFSLGVNDPDRLNDVLGLLREGQETGILPRDSISEVHFDNDFGFTLYTLQDALPIHVGFADFEEKLKMLARVQKDLQARNITPGAIRLLSRDEAHVKRGSSS